MSTQPTQLRKWRTERGHSLDDMCELIARAGFERPSAAKLSRIERDQDVPIDMIAALEAATGIPANVLRPDLAKIFERSAGDAA